MKFPGFLVRLRDRSGTLPSHLRILWIIVPILLIGAPILLFVLAYRIDDDLDLTPNLDLSQRTGLVGAGAWRQAHFRARAHFPLSRADFGCAGSLPHAGGRSVDDADCALSGSSAHGVGQESVGESELVGVGTA